MDSEIIISSIDNIIEIKKRPNAIFNKIDILLKAQDILLYVNSLKTSEDKVAIALDFIKNNATAEQKLELLDIYPKWSYPIYYEEGTELQYNGKLYRVLYPGHTSQIDWEPSVDTSSLFIEIVPPGLIAEWVEPYGGSKTYVLGAKILYKGSVYENIFTGDTYNVWSPEGYPAGWKKIEQ